MCFVIYAPLCLVRKIEKFSITHIFADALILITTIVVSDLINSDVLDPHLCHLPPR